jgi:hypothetical protein
MGDLFLFSRRGTGAAMAAASCSWLFTRHFRPGGARAVDDHVFDLLVRAVIDVDQLAIMATSAPLRWIPLFTDLHANALLLFWLYLG